MNLKREHYPSVDLEAVVLGSNEFALLGVLMLHPPQHAWALTLEFRYSWNTQHHNANHVKPRAITPATKTLTHHTFIYMP
jgi:hypothetical protein